MELPRQFGRYTLVGKIASGGTAEVYRAILSTGNGFEKPVAVKRLLPSWCENEELKEMLMDEARILTHLRHQAITQVLELGSEKGIPFIAMEYIEGIDCSRLLERIILDATPLPVSHVLYIISQVLLALEFAHRLKDPNGCSFGIVHRDVSPSNILLSWNGEVKVTDFGIAKGVHRTRLTSSGLLRGKYSYMSPEQARGAALDARSDIFSCGVVLLELLTASRLFDAGTDLEVIELVRNASLPAEKISSLHPSLQAILFPALSPDLKCRYLTAAEMLNDVRSAAQAMGGMATGLELADYLRRLFEGDWESGQMGLALSICGDKRVTRVIDGQPAPACVGFVRAKGLVRMAKAGATILLLFAVTAVVPADADRKARPKPRASVSAAGDEVPGRKVEMPKTAGAIAIDTEPKGADGVLTIGEEERRIKTPFAMDGIEIAGRLAGHVRLRFNGYHDVEKGFQLTDESPAFVENFKLERIVNSKLHVQARPWGLVNVKGYISNRETPVSSLELKPGSHVVMVSHPPTGRAVKREVALVPGKSVRCQAVFDSDAKMTCR